MKLGDFIERITYYTGIQYIVNKIKAIFEIEDCGCKNRQEKWNDIELW
jgi:hypothetical protein